MHRPNYRRPQPQEPRYPAFSIFLCTHCFKLEEDVELRSCPHCGSDRYRKRFVQEKEVTSYQQAVEYFFVEMQRDFVKLRSILQAHNRLPA